MPNRPDVLAAGAVVLRKPGDEVLLVHRPKYDDWSFPKGKLDPRRARRPPPRCARSREETGLRVRLGPPLPDQRYAVAGGRTRPSTTGSAGWSATTTSAATSPNHEIDEVAWVAARRGADAADLPRATGDTLREARASGAGRPGRWSCCATPRRAPARPGKATTATGRCWPAGTEQARAAGAAAGGVRRRPGGHLAAAPAASQTVTPYAEHAGVARRVRRPAVSEEDATAAAVGDVVAELLDARRRGPVLCTHRPVLPTVLEAARRWTAVSSWSRARCVVVAPPAAAGRVATETHHVR